MQGVVFKMCHVLFISGGFVPAARSEYRVLSDTRQSGCHHIRWQTVDNTYPLTLIARGE